MSTHDSPGKARRGWREWLGFGADNGTDEDDATKEAPAAGREPTVREIWLPAKRRLLSKVVDFLIDNDLDILPFTLSIAYDCVTGGSPRLSQKILERIEQGQPLTLSWLEEMSSSQARDKSAEAVAELVGKLDESLDTVSGTMAKARSATGEYSKALESHVEELQRATQTETVITELTEIARVMIDRTRLVERELAKSEQQVAGLQKSLEETRRKAELDYLTGLPNRRAFDHMFERELREAELGKEPMAVAFCDIDHFKRINDTHGHPAGDRVLKYVAETLSRVSNAKCHVARHGGEEFALIFRGSTVEQARKKLDAAREEMAARILVNRINDTPFGRVTFSGGIADVFAYRSRAAALKAADKALYLAKENGRNQIVVAGRAPPPLRKAS